jgi:hypothetical protein
LHVVLHLTARWRCGETFFPLAPPRVGRSSALSPCQKSPARITAGCTALSLSFSLPLNDLLLLLLFQTVFSLQYKIETESLFLDILVKKYASIFRGEFQHVVNGHFFIIAFQKHKFSVNVLCCLRQ